MTNDLVRELETTAECVAAASADLMRRAAKALRWEREARDDVVKACNLMQEEIDRLEKERQEERESE